MQINTTITSQLQIYMIDLSIYPLGFTTELTVLHFLREAINLDGVIVECRFAFQGSLVITICAMVRDWQMTQIEFDIFEGCVLICLCSDIVGIQKEKGD